MDLVNRAIQDQKATSDSLQHLETLGPIDLRTQERKPSSSVQDAPVPRTLLLGARYLSPRRKEQIKIVSELSPVSPEGASVSPLNFILSPLISY